MFVISRIDHVALTVRDQQRSGEWYRRILGMERRYPEANGEGDPIFVGAGNACLALFPAQTAEPLPPPGYDVLAMRHVAFCLDCPNFERAQHELHEQQIAFRLVDHGFAHSLYFTDPDGHRLELTTYELA